MRRVRRGDDRAFELLYSRYQRRITAYIHGMVHDHGRAEDIAQDVFVSALRRIRETDRTIAFKPWIYEIAKNACIDQFRRSRRAEEISYDAADGLGAADYGRLVSADAMPEAELESKQQLDHLCGAFGGLSEAHHDILVMRELEGLSYREIGERLGMSRPSVESTLFRARRRLAEEYEELVTGTRCRRIQAIIDSAAESELGVRDQRRLARHVAHCQPCRRHARYAGVEVPPLVPVRQRVAALLPLPLFLRRRWLGGSGGGADPVQAAGALHLGTLAQWTTQLGSTVDPSWLKAAAAAATVAAAGVGAGVAANNGGLPFSPDHVSAGAVSHRGASAVGAAHSAAAPGIASRPGTTGFSRVAGAHVGASARRDATDSVPAPTRTRTQSAPPAAPAPQGRGVPAVPDVAAGLGKHAADTLPPPPPSSPPNSGSGGVPTVSIPVLTPKTAPPVQAPDLSGAVGGATTGATSASDSVQSAAGAATQKLGQTITGG